MGSRTRGSNFLQSRQRRTPTHQRRRRQNETQQQPADIRCENGDRCEWIQGGHLYFWSEVLAIASASVSMRGSLAFTSSPPSDGGCGSLPLGVHSFSFTFVSNRFIQNLIPFLFSCDRNCQKLCIIQMFCILSASVFMSFLSEGHRSVSRLT